MEALRAFVGHSFDPVDKPTVERFLEFFDSLKKPMNFDWVHAEQPEPRALSKKIREKMEGRNLFIGIFTAKDWRVKHDKLRGVIKWRYGSKADFAIGTSEWIIQESGYALAKNMELLFLVEDGVHVSAGLPGDLEVIKFPKANPDSCFTKINHMIGYILPSKVSKPILEEKTVSPIRVEEQQPEHDASQQTKEAKEESPRSPEKDDVIEIFALIMDQKNFSVAREKIREFSDKHQKAEHFDEIRWRSVFYDVLDTAGDPEGLSELQMLSNENPAHPWPLVRLGHAYRRYKMYAEAARKYLEASEKIREKEDQVDLICRASSSCALDGKFEQAYHILLERFSDTELQNAQYHQLYIHLANIAREEKNNDLFSPFAEKALEHSPADGSTRFSLAYHYSEAGKNALALYHYKILCEREASGMILNNLGVAQSQLNMQYKSVLSYRRASDEYKETLAMANLAQKYIAQGFLGEADIVLKKATAEQDYHKNVDSALLEIKNIIRKEEELERATLEGVDRERKFRIGFADAYAMPTAVDIEGDWGSKHGIMSLAIDDGKVYGKGEEETELPDFNALASALSGVTFGGIPRAQVGKKKKTLELNGLISNRGIIYKLKMRTITSPLSILGESESNYEGCMIISRDLQSIEVMEKEVTGETLEFYRMKKAHGPGGT